MVVQLRGDAATGTERGGTVTTPTCRCLHRRDTCPGSCPVSRETELHRRECGECHFNEEVRRGSHGLQTVPTGKADKNRE